MHPESLKFLAPWNLSDIKVVELQALLDAHNAEQVEPLWPSVLEDYVPIDKTDEDELLPTDEYIYWPNGSPTREFSAGSVCFHPSLRSAR